ncbi:MAG: hypothetical protein LBJ57_01510 [Prevotellaceae bacterium]|jgi:hypothetical protein|nr:hypothetical protein [Prevotellaceae bacterium]
MREAITNKIYWWVSGALLAVYLLIVYQNAVNVPQYDDFVVLLNFLSEFIQSASFSEKFSLITSQHNEHRLVFTRLLVLLCYCITGKVSLSAFIIISNLFLLGVSLLFLMYVKSKKYAPMAMLLIVALLFNGQNFQTSTWAMAGLANIGTLLLAMLSIYLVSYTSTSANNFFIAGLALAAATIFSNGNGLCLLPSLSLSLLLQKRKKELIWFVLLIGAAAACYFIGYKPMAHKTSLLDLALTSHVLAVNFFNFIGCNLWLPSLKFISFLWGVFIFLTYLLAAYQKYYKKNIAWFSFFTFMLLTAAAVALNRSDGEVGPLRYRIYGCMFSILTVIFYVENRDFLHIKYFRLIVAPIVAFSIFSTLFYYDKVRTTAEFQKMSTYSWRRSKDGLAAFFVSKDSLLLAKAEALGVYAMPKIPLSQMASKVEANDKEWRDLSSPIQCGVDYITEQDELVVIKGWVYHEVTAANFMNISLWLLGDDEKVKVSPYAGHRYHIADDVVKISCEFFAVIPKAAIPPGSYELGVELQRRYIIWSAKTFSRNTGIQVTWPPERVGETL